MLLFWLFFNIICGVFSDIPFFLKNLDQNNIDLKNRSINDSINPCTNFYKHACSIWKLQTKKPNFEPYWNHFTSASFEINKKVQKILDTPSQENNPIEKAKQFYNSCVNFEANQDKYLVQLKVLVEYLQGWPIVEENWSDESYDWLGKIAQITKMLGLHPILKIYVSVDYKNTEKYVLYIEPGTLIFPQNILLNPKHFSTELTAYTQWILKTIQHFYPARTVSKRGKLDVLKIVEFEMQLAKLMSVKPKMERNYIEQVSKRFNVNFLRIFGTIFKDIGVHLMSKDIVVIRNYGYFKNLMKFLNKIDAKSIANYIIWSVIKDLSRDTTKYLQNLNFFIDKSVLGITSDISRDTECTNKVIDHFSFAILPKYLDQHFDESILQNVHKIVKNIKEEFISLLGDNKWLSNGTKLLAVEKVMNINSLVGYPQWVKNFTELELYYQDLNITDDHLLNILSAKNFKTEKNLRMLKKQANTPMWPSNIFDVNAYYSILQNSVFIPLGILQSPFYQKTSTSVFNYGAIGSLIGHELSHSLDTTGRQANLNGIISKWWPTKDIFDYQSKAKCFEQLYNKDNTKNQLSVGENIADNVGLDISYRAYKNLKDFNFEDIFWDPENEDKKFFISYAQIWCEISDQLDLFNDEHTSVEARVNQAVLNNKHFKEIFGCIENTLENNICKLW